MIENLLLRLTELLPCRFIDGDNGEPYLERYYLFGTLGWHVYIHRFVGSDPDRGLHDHPWSRAISLVLKGGYDELRLLDDGETRIRFIRPWRLNSLRGEDFHRVVLREGRSAWTLFMHGARVKGWGFVQHGELRPMAEDALEFRHRDWWKSAPAGREMRASRETSPQHS